MIEAVPLFRKSGALANNIRKPALNAWGQPTSRRLEVPRVAVIDFEGDKIASEHIYYEFCGHHT